jgi:hypothetical protein
VFLPLVFCRTLGHFRRRAAAAHRPGFPAAGPKVRSWMPQLGQDGNPKGGLVECLRAILGPLGGNFRRLEHCVIAGVFHSA